MRRKSQAEFGGRGFQRPKDWFGGSALKSHPKTRRPLDSKLPIHLVLRARRSVLRLPENFGRIRAVINRASEKYGIRIYEYANVGNHLHLLVKVPNVVLWRRFIREITVRIAQISQKIAGKEKGSGFWMHRPFTRIVRGWKRAYRVVQDYVLLNHLQAEGFIDRGIMRTVADLRRYTESLV